MQQSLFKKRRANTKIEWIEREKVYGGALNYRRCERPLDSKRLTHIVFKARLGDGIWFTRSQKSIEKLLLQSARRYRLKIKSFSIQRDHVHVLAYGQGKRRLQRTSMIQFLRFFAAGMGRKYGLIYRRWGLNKNRSLWRHRPFTRLVRWGRKSILAVVQYLKRNDLEALGFLDYKPRKHRLQEFLRSLNSG